MAVTLNLTTDTETRSAAQARALGAQPDGCVQTLPEQQVASGPLEGTMNLRGFEDQPDALAGGSDKVRNLLPEAPARENGG